MPFKKGEGGRPRGAANKATREFKEFWRDFLDSEAYRQNCQQRITDGKAPHVEAYLLNKIHGRPTEHIKHEGEVTMPAQVIFELHRDA